MAIKYPIRTGSNIEKELQVKKASRTLNGVGVPKDNEGSDGDITINSVGNGIKLYAKYNGRWYGTRLYPLRSENTITKLSNTTDGTVGNEINDTTSTSIKDDFASLTAKINEILDRIG